MKLNYDCIPCLMSSVIRLAKQTSDDIETQKEIIAFGLNKISELAFTKPAPYIMAQVYAYASQLTGITDPFMDEKTLYNKIAEQIMVEYDLQKKVSTSENPLETAVRLSIAGNIIDFSVGYSLDKSVVEKSIVDSLSADLFGMNMTDFEKRIQEANSILVIADNSGEIVFDKLLIRLLPKDKTVYAVKSGPIVNDATMLDAVETGMDKLVKVIENGNAIQGTILETCSEAFMDVFNAADLVISKGQANFETLSHLVNKTIFFMLRAKCEAVAKEVGCEKGQYVFIESSKLYDGLIINENSSLNERANTNKSRINNLEKIPFEYFSENEDVIR